MISSDILQFNQFTLPGNYCWVQFSRSVVSDSLRPHELHHTRPPCPSPAPRVHPDSCPSSLWCHPAISSSVIPFSSCAQSFPASGSFPMSQFLASGGQSTGTSASTSVLPMNTRDWSALGWTGWTSLQSSYCYFILNKFVIIFYHTIFRAISTSFLTPNVDHWFLFNSRVICWLLESHRFSIWYRRCKSIKCRYGFLLMGQTFSLILKVFFIVRWK